VVLGLGALFWTVRAGGFVADVGDAPWVFLVAALDVVGVVLVMSAAGPAKHVGALAGGVELLAVGLRWDAPPVVSALSALHGAALIAMTVSEPGERRLRVGGAVGSAAAVAALAALAWAVVPKPQAREVIRDEVAGYTLALPDGWRPAREREVAPHLVLPWDGGKTVNVAFWLPEPLQVGVLTVSRDEQPALEEACRGALARFGVTAFPAPVDGPPPQALGRDAKVFELRTKTGAAGRFGCALVGTKLVALAVVSQDPAPGIGAAAFEQVVAGLAVEP